MRSLPVFSVSNSARTLALVAAAPLPGVLLAATPAASPTPVPSVDGKNVAEATPSKHSFLDPVDDFVRDDILHPVAPFQFVPGKDPNGWAFSLEPYLWLTGISGTTGVGDLPALDVNASAKSLLQNLNWGIMSKGEVRKGRWGILADGYYASLSASGDLGGTFYQSGTLDLQQAFVSLALAYRVIDDRRGFLDLYAGARYNYLGLQVSLNLDNAGITQFGENAVSRVSTRVSDATRQAVDAAAVPLANQLAAKLAASRQAGANQLVALQKQIQKAIKQGQTADVAALQAKQAQVSQNLQQAVTNGVTQIAALKNEVSAAATRDLAKELAKRAVVVPKDVRRAEDRKRIESLLNPMHREFRDLVQSNVQRELAAAKSSASSQLQNQLVSLATQRVAAAERLLATAKAQGSSDARAASSRLVASSQAQLATAKSRQAAAASAASSEVAALDKQIAKAEKKLAKKISQQVEDSLPTSGAGDQWWIDPIIGARAQVNLTRWLFLAAQSDVGGFGAGSQITWNVQATIGVNFTRNIFGELGYRYMYVDYDKNDFLYKMNTYGIYSGLGFKF